MMQKILTLLLTILITTTLQAQDNPYESLGIDVKVITLSNGKYKEYFDDERFVQIGNVVYDIEEMKLVRVINRDSIPDNFYLLPLSDSRWISPDPLSDEFTSVSPYNFGFNNPIRFNDPTGLAPESPLTDYYDGKGNLLLHTDDNSNDVVIVNAGRERQFNIYANALSSIGVDLASSHGKEALTGFGVTYDMDSFNEFYDANAGDINGGIDGEPYAYDDGFGQKPAKVANEHATGLYLGESGKVTTGNENIKGTSPDYIPPGRIQANGNNIGWLHTEPTGGRELYYKNKIGNATTYSSNVAGNEPSPFDFANYSKEGSKYFSVISRPNSTVFFKSTGRVYGKSTGNYFVVPKNK